MHRRFAEAEGMNILGEYVEVETGKGADALDRRPQLAAALLAAKKKPGAASWSPSSIDYRVMSPSSRA
jgi:hypothetical protein